MTKITLEISIVCKTKGKRTKQTKKKQKQNLYVSTTLQLIKLREPRSNDTLVATSTCVDAKLLQSCPTLCDPMDCRLPGSSVHGILQVGILEWVAMPSSRGSSPQGHMG